MMIRTPPILLLTLLCLLALLGAPLAAAQVPSLFTNTPTAPAKPASPAPPAASITPDQARQALDVLNDPVRRAEITATLEAIARAQPAAAATAPAASSTAALGIPLAPDSLGAAVLVGGSNFMNGFTNRVSAALRAAHGAPLLWLWLVTMATDPVAHTMLIDLSWRLVVALAGAFAVLWAISRALRRPLRAVGRRLVRLPPTAARGDHPVDHAMDHAWDDVADEAVDDPAAEVADDAADELETGEARAELGAIEPPAPRRFHPSRLVRRVPLVLARAALELAPVLGFAVAGHIIAGSELGSSRLVRLVLLAVIDSYALCAAAVRLARAMLAPRHRRLRLLPVPNATAAYALRWTRRLLVVSVFGYAIAEVGLLLGMSEAAHLAVLKVVVLILHICVGTIVVQKRRVVRRWIRAPAAAPGEAQGDAQGDAQGQPLGVVARARNRFAAIWHWIALFYLASLWLVWAAALPAGYGVLSRLLVATLTVVVLVRVATTAGVGALARLVHAGSERASAFPGLDARLSFYHPFLRTFLQVGVLLVGLLMFLQLLGLDAIQWLTSSPLGQHIAGSLVTLALIFLLALAAWEAVNIGIERHLAHLTRQAQIARIARLRTLLPIVRTALLVAVVTVTMLMALSEIGVNTAPLLASAGIIGVAIGFGSQKLVQDLITGLFLLLENTMQVGDTVSLGGLTGVVENLSVRTIRLRAEDGSVHVIPFSSVTTVTNMTRDYARAVIHVSVAYKENIDHVIEVLKGILTGMRGDAQFRQIILGDLEVFGLDQFAPSAVMIKARVMCTPFGRWSVGREFNRRMKARFDELGIAMPSADQRLIVDQPLTISIGATSAGPTSLGAASPGPALPSLASSGAQPPSERLTET
jgi:small-conductance mechanosensitive channel